MMAVLQIALLGLIMLSNTNPCFSALNYLWLVNGYNTINKNHLSDPLTPNQPKGIYLFSQFLHNFNFTLALILIPLLIALVAFILKKTAMKSR